MDEDVLGFLSGGTEDTAAAPTPAQEPAAAAALEPAGQDAPGGPVRGADGRFAPRDQGGGQPAQAAQAPAPAAQAAAPAAAPPEPGHVPLSAVLDEREKRQAAERRLAEIEQRQRAAQDQARNAELPPDVRVSQALHAQNLRSSRRFAEREYGKETIAAVHDWVVAKCDSDPAFNQQMLASEDPYEAAYQAYQREQVLSRVKPDELAQYEAWKAAQAAGGQAPAPASAGAAAPAAPQPAAPAPPRSLVNQPNAGGGAAPQVAVGPGEAHASLFRR